MTGVTASLPLNDEAKRRILCQTLPKVLAANKGQLPRAEADRLADLVNTSPRTVYRIAKTFEDEHGIPGPDELGLTCLERLEKYGAEAFVFDDEIRGLLMQLGGNMSQLREELVRARFPVPSLSSLSRQFRKEVPLTVRKGLRAGHDVRTRSRTALHIRHSAPTPNDVWQFDEFELDIEVNTNRGKKVRPRLLLLIDDHSRFVVSWGLFDHAVRSVDLLAVLAAGFEVRDDDLGTGRLIGGLCDRLIYDNAQAFRSHLVRDLLKDLPVDRKPTPVYSPSSKGKVERAGQIIQDKLTVGLAGWRSRAARIDGSDLLATPSEGNLYFGEYVEFVRSVVHEHNYVDVHSTLGCTRFTAYTRDGIAPRYARDEELAPMWLIAERDNGERKVFDDGVKLKSRYYNSEDLHMHVDERVQVRVLPNRSDRVAVFGNKPDFDELIGIVPLSSQLTEQERREVVAGRIADMKTITRAATAARAGMLRRAELLSGVPGVVQAHLNSLGENDDAFAADGAATDDEEHGPDGDVDGASDAPADDEADTAQTARTPRRPGRRPATIGRGDRGDGGLPGEAPVDTVSLAEAVLDDGLGAVG